MEFVGTLSGGAPYMLEFQVGETMANSNVPVRRGGAGEEGILLCTTTAAADYVGLAVTSATLVTAQQSDNSDTAREVTVIVNPDAVLKARLSGSSTTGADLTLYTVTTASTTGLDVVTGDDFTNFDEGTIHCVSGANAGISRKITVGDATDASVTVAFPRDIAIGDTFIVAPFTPGEDQFVQLTADFLEVDASATVDTDNDNFRVLKLDLNGVADSYVYLLPFDSLYAAGGSI